MYPGGAGTWFNGIGEGEHQQHQTPTSPRLLSTYHMNSGDVVSSSSSALDVYHMSHENTSSAGFYVPYQTTVVDSDDDDEDETDDDDDDDEDSTYHLPKHGGNHGTGTTKNGGQRRSSRPNGSKRKRKRVLNGVQRAEATQREKRRMLKLNRAFEELRKVLPVTEFARNKLSRSETLKSAIDYINLMFDMLDAAKGHHHHVHHPHHQHQHPSCL